MQVYFYIIYIFIIFSLLYIEKCIKLYKTCIKNLKNIIELNYFNKIKLWIKSQKIKYYKPNKVIAYFIVFILILIFIS